MSERPPYRLPRHAVPQRYDLELRPDLGEGRFEGSVSILLDVRETVKEMVLNAVDLSLEDPTLSRADTTLRGAVTYRPQQEQAVLTWPTPIAPGAWKLSVRFAGPLGQTLRGFYRTEVTDREGKAARIASTHCEPTGARRIFPCWDEPDLKAVFALTVVVEDGLVALSNGEEAASEAAGPGLRRVRFADTMPMSTYLVALAVGPFAVSEPLLVGRTPVRVAARPKLIHLAGMARDEAAACLRFFEDYFGIAYPAAKLDHVAIPEFEAGAMENLGLVTYREELLLADPERASPGERMQIAETIAHETAHMWFGDLVTMRWWNGIWLNEAFATFMAVLACDAIHPEWKVWNATLPERGYAMTIDGLASTRPIEFPVGPPAEAEAMFDALTYAKGGAVLRMLEQHLGPDVFQAGIRLYLERHRHANTDTADLWRALEDASGQPVEAVMHSWVFQGGYPLVHVEGAPGAAAITLRQAPFSYGGEAKGIWQVPVAVGFARPDGRHESVRLLLGEAPETVRIPDDAAWVLVNAGGWGFYRVAYDGPLLERVVAAWPALSEAERYGLAEDVWAAVQAGQVAVGQALRLWRTFGDERDPDLWGAVDRHLRLLDVMADDAGRRALAAFARTIAGTLFAALGWEPAPGESVQQTRLRARLLAILGATGRDEAVRREAHRRLIAHVGGEQALAPSLLSEVAHIVAATGGEAEWELLYGEFRAATTPQDQVRYLYALASVQTPALVRRTLDLYRSAEVRSQDAPIALATMLNNRHARRAAWDVIERDWDEMLATYEPAIVQHWAATVASIVEPDLADRVAAWLGAHPVPQAAPQIAQALEFQAVHRALAGRVREALSSLEAGG